MGSSQSMTAAVPKEITRRRAQIESSLSPYLLKITQLSLLCASQSYGYRSTSFRGFAPCLHFKYFFNYLEITNCDKDH